MDKYSFDLLCIISLLIFLIAVLPNGRRRAVLLIIVVAVFLIGSFREESHKKVHADNPINPTTCRRVKCPENDFDESLNKKLQECEARNKALEKTLEDVVDDRFEDEDSGEW